MILTISAVAYNWFVPHTRAQRYWHWIIHNYVQFTHKL